ncbi:MAG TPA: acetolactate decarboxylase [Bryobacteraceae bacterium]|nr:acetolactate decarboxylase [Bryobacteraceae bacterium]
MKRSRVITAIGICLAIGMPAGTTAQTDAASAATTASPNAGVLFQVSTLDALLQGVYSASFSGGQLKKHGNFGLGTYEGLDGEMIVLDGHYYHMRSNGVLSESDDSEVAPFAAITEFQPSVQFTVNNSSMADLSTLIDSVLPTRNYFYAIRIHGAFSTITTRAIPMQFLPYPPLSQLIPVQSMFTYSNVTGTAVDIRSPAFAAGINQVAHHYHFVSDDLKGGGHALSFTTGQVDVAIQTLRRYDLWLPNDELFQKATLPFVQP